MSARTGRGHCWPILTTATLVGTAMLATGCGGGGHSSSLANTTGSAAYRTSLAFAQCMRAHGLANFPIPNPAQDSSVAGRPNAKPNSPAARAYDACQHLLAATSAQAAGTPRPRTSTSPPALDCLTASRCYAPRQFDVAYGIQPLRERGITGRGITVVLPEEAETGAPRPRPLTDILQSVTDIRQDLAYFDKRFGLPPARIQPITSLAGSSASPWLAGVEEVEDTELVHAVAPGATIREVLVGRSDVQTRASFAAAFSKWVRLADRNGEVISQSGMGQDFDLGERSCTRAEVATINAALEDAAARHVTVVVATGDYGAIGHGSSTPVKDVSLPASDPLALAAGGSTLRANPLTGAYVGETAWNTMSGTPNAASSGAGGGGFSRLFPRPT